MKGQSVDSAGMEDREAVRAAAMADLQTLTASFPTEEPQEYGRYTNAWDEETWERDFDNHPLFMRKAPEDPANLPPLVEAMRQLKYDPEQNDPKELAERYKKDGNENFRLKKYRWAVDNYSAGIRIKADDTELNSTLYGNRAAAHLRLGNMRSALNDSLVSVRLNPGNEKSVVRIGECYLYLKDYATCVQYCRKHVLEHDRLQEVYKRAQKELALREEEAQSKQKAVEAEAQHRSTLMHLVSKDRGIDVRGDLFSSPHPASSGRHVELSDEGHLMWPVIFVYPEFSQTDFIEYFDEETTFRQQLDQLFGDEADRPAWDHSGKYTPDRLRIAFPRSHAPDHMIPVHLNSTLRHVLASPDYKLTSSTPVFSVVAVNNNKK